MYREISNGLSKVQLTKLYDWLKKTRGQCKTKTGDYRLSTGGKIKTEEVIVEKFEKNS